MKVQVRKKAGNLGSYGTISFSRTLLRGVRKLKGIWRLKIFQKLENIYKYNSDPCTLLLHGSEDKCMYANRPAIDLWTVRTSALFNNPWKITINVRAVETNRILGVWGSECGAASRLRSSSVGSCDARFRDPDFSVHSNSGVSNFLQDESNYKEEKVNMVCRKKQLFVHRST